MKKIIIIVDIGTIEYACVHVLSVWLAVCLSVSACVIILLN